MAAAEESEAGGRERASKSRGAWGMSWSMKWPAPQEMEMGRPSPASTSGRLCRHGGGEHAERSTPDERAAKREPGHDER